MSTTLVLIRHAKPEHYNYLNDPPLSEEGKIIQKKMAVFLKEKGYIPSLILTSPFKRAIQTAEILAAEMSDSLPVVIENALGSDFDSAKLLKKIPDPTSNQTLFFIGHNPTLANFANLLTGKTLFQWGMEKSSAAIIQFHDTVAFNKANFIDYFTPQKVLT